MTPTAEMKWTAGVIGPRQLKAFNEAIAKFNWEAKTITERGDHGDYNVTPMFMGQVNPMAAPLMNAIKEKYGATVTAENHKDIILEIVDAQVRLIQNRVVVDKRTTPEEKAETARIIAEREEKERAAAAHKATLKHHEYGLAETSKAVKQVLGVLFPTTTFSVKSKSYSGGCSIDASWTDGPTEKQVKPVLDVFSRAWFDGMDDLEHHVGPSEWEGHLFDFRGNYVHGSRSHSAAFLRECAERFANETGMPAPEVKEERGYCHVERTGQACGWSFSTTGAEEHPEGWLSHDDTRYNDAADIVGQIAHHTSKEQPAHALGRQDYEGEWEITKAVVFRILLGELGPTQADPSSLDESPTSTTGATLRENKEKGGLEIVFATKPAASVLADLKANGFRWSFHTKCWWIKANPAARRFAEALTGGTGLLTKAAWDSMTREEKDALNAQTERDAEDHGLKAMTDVDSQMERQMEEATR